MNGKLRVALSIVLVAGAAIVCARTSVGTPLILTSVPADNGPQFAGEPVIIVTKSEITWEEQHQLVTCTELALAGKECSQKTWSTASADAGVTRRVRCDLVVEKLKQAVAMVDPGIAVLASTKSPIVLSSCIYESWPEELKECIATASANEIAAHKCDALVPDEIAQKLIDRLAPGRQISPRDFLQR